MVDPVQAATQAPAPVVAADAPPVPTVYDQASKARAAGYSWNEINDFLANGRAEAIKAGYTNEEVNDHLGLPPTTGTLRFQGEPGQPPVASTYAANLPGNIRAFSDKYLTPQSESGENAGFKIKTAGDLAKAAGWDIVDIGKVFGRPVVNGIAAIMEGLDEQPRTDAEMQALGQEAQPALGILAGTGFGAKAAGGAVKAFPKPQEVIDAATSVVATAKAAVEPAKTALAAGEEADSHAELDAAMRGIGQHYLNTGEAPIDAAVRAKSDPALAQQLSGMPMPDQTGAEARSPGLKRERSVEFTGMGERVPGYPASSFQDIQRGPDFNQAADRVLKLEGGMTTDTGGRTIYGISEKANPDAWENGPPTLDEARQIYKSRYWDAINADNLPGSMRLEAFDAAVNQGVGWTKQALAQADNDPEKFMQLREQKYEALASGNPDKYAKYLKGWLNRLKELGFEPGGATDVGLVGKFADKLGTEEGGGGPLGSLGEQEKAIANYPRPNVPDLPIDPETITLRNPSLQTGILDDFRRAFSPYNRSDEAAEAAGVIRQKLAEDAVFGQRMTNTLRAFDRSIAELPTKYRMDFANAVETGDLERFANHPLGDAAHVMRSYLDAAWGDLNDRGILNSYIENYLPHLYKDPARAAQFFGGKTWDSSKFFTRERTFATLHDAMEAGHVPITDNPLRLAAHGIMQMHKAITAHDAMAELATNKLAISADDLSVMGKNAPSGLVRLDPRIARLDDKAFYAPEQVATLFNRTYQPGLRPFTSYQVLRSGANMLNSSQLGMSFFHAGFITADSFTSGIAKGIKQISRLSPSEMVQGIQSLAISPAKPVMNFIAGRKVIRQILGDADYGPGIQTLADSLIAGGGRVGTMTDYTAESSYGSFWRAFRGSLQKAGGEATGEITLKQDITQMFRDEFNGRSGPVQYTLSGIKVMAQMLPRVMDTIMAPLFEQYVPIMKTGVFADLMSDELRVNPNMEPVALRATAGRVWNSVDNRMGQVVYDNLFWNKTMQDIGHIGIRAQGWLAGEIREIPGGIANLAKGRAVSAGEFRQIHDNASYALAIPVAAAMMGSMYGILTGSWTPDWSIQDYMFPPDAKGNRVSMPGYFKDIYSAVTHPVTEATNKVHPLITAALEMMNNADWSGAAITDPRGNLLDKVEDYGQFIFHQFEPIIAKQYDQLENGNIPFEQFVQNFFGVKPAPYEVREPGKTQHFENKDVKQRVRKMTRERLRGQE